MATDLLVAARRQRDVGGEGRGAATTTWKLAAPPRPSRVPLTPRLLSLQVPDSAPLLGDDIALQVEFVAVAGAGQGLIEAVAAAAHGIGGAAADPLGRAVVEGDGAAAGPDARPCRRTAPIARGWRSRTWRPQTARRAANISRRMIMTLSAVRSCLTAATLPSDRCTVCRRMRHSICPIRCCR